jgi:hypothetical protein
MTRSGDDGVAGKQRIQRQRSFVHRMRADAKCSISDRFSSEKNQDQLKMKLCDTQSIELHVREGEE